MILNPFLEGLIGVVLGLTAYAIGDRMKFDLFVTAGTALFWLGMGYMGGNKVGQTNSGETK